MSGTQWVSAHLFSHSGLDALLAEAIAPAVTELTDSGVADGFFFVRHWDGGPHVRLRLAVRDGEGRRRAAAHVRDRCGRYLREHRAPVRLDPATYAQQARWLAGLEGLTAYQQAPWADGSLLFIPYRPDHERYGDESAMAAVEQHFVAGSRIALSLVVSATPVQRSTAAFCMLLLAAPGGPSLTAPGLTAPGRPGSREFWPDGSGWPGRYDAQRDRLQALADRCEAIVTSAAGLPGSLAAWHQAVEALRAQLGRIGAPSAAATLGHCAHLMCNRLGVSINEEGLLRYLAGRTLHDRQPAERSTP